MKKILGLGMVALLVMALVGGGTWAYFNDVETSGDNILSAGTLNLGLSNTGANDTATSSVNGTWAISNMVPGAAATSASLYVRSSGTINMASVNLTFAYVTTNGTSVNVTGWDGVATTDDLAQMLIAETVSWNGSGSNNATWMTGKTLAQISANSINLGPINAGTQGMLTIGWSLSAAATNGCQGDSANITISLTGQQ